MQGNIPLGDMAPKSVPKVKNLSQTLHYITNLNSMEQHIKKRLLRNHLFHSIKFARKMLGKKLGSVKKLAKKVKRIGNVSGPEASHYECLLGDKGGDTAITPTGTFVVYVGEDRQRFAVPTDYLSHPLFKILLDKAYNEFGFDQRNGLVVPCRVAAFQEVINAVEYCNGRFEFGDLVEELI